MRFLHLFIFNLHFKMSNRQLISKTLIKNLEARSKPYEVRDRELSGFMVRVNTSGTKNYIVQYARGKRIPLGRTNVLSPEQARQLAIKTLSDFANGIDPQQAKKAARKNPRLKQFFNDDYMPWFESHYRTGKNQRSHVSKHFKFLFDTPLNESVIFL